jgi:hypothetical protein
MQHAKSREEQRLYTAVLLWDEEEAMRLEDFVDKKVVVQPAGEHRPMESGALVSVAPQGIVVLVEGDPAVARPNEYRFYPWSGLTFIAHQVTT